MSINCCILLDKLYFFFFHITVFDSHGIRGQPLKTPERERFKKMSKIEIKCPLNQKITLSRGQI